MNISLPAELEQYVYRKVDSGLYTSASEVVRESLRLMNTYDGLQKQRVDQLNQAIDIGLAQLKAGRKIPASESYQRLNKKIKNMSKKSA